MRRIAGGLFALALGAAVFARAASAATIPVSYVVDEKMLKTLAPAGTLLTIELYEDSACSGAVAATAAVDVDAVTVKERIKTLKPKGSAQKPLKLVELYHVFTSVNPTPGADLFVKVTSAVPGAIDTTAVGACQAQEPAPAGPSPSTIAMVTNFASAITCDSPPCNGSAFATCPPPSVRVGLVDCVASGNANPVNFLDALIPPGNASTLGCSYELTGSEVGVTLTMRILCVELP